MKLSDKTIVITGASGGIGSALCKELSTAGAKLILTSENNDKLEKLAKELNGEVEYSVSDFTSTQGVQQFADFVLRKTDTVDILFNAAGIGIYKLYCLSVPELNAPLVTTSPYFFISLTSMILGTQLFLAGFIAELISRSSPDRNKYLIAESVNLD